MRLRYVNLLSLLAIVPLVVGCDHTHKSLRPCCPAPSGQPACGAAVPAPPPPGVALPPQYIQSGYGQISFGR